MQVQGEAFAILEKRSEDLRSTLHTTSGRVTALEGVTAQAGAEAAQRHEHLLAELGTSATTAEAALAAQKEGVLLAALRVMRDYAVMLSPACGALEADDRPWKRGGIVHGTRRRT